MTAADGRLKELNRSQKIKSSAIQYGLSLASGLATFVGLKILQHGVASDAVFSRLSVLLLSFTTFQLVSDLGTQTAFLRAYHLASQSRRSALCCVLIQSRFLLGILIIALAACYAFASDFSGQLTFSFLCYHLAFIPFAFISAADSIFLARLDFAKAILSRLARLVSLVVFLLVAIKTSEYSELFAPIASTISFTLLGIISWIFFLRPLLNTENALVIKNVFHPDVWKILGRDAKSFLHGSWIAAVATAIISAQNMIGQSLTYRSLGENHLTALNTSIALSTPTTLAFQTLVQLVTPQIAVWISAPQKVLFEQYGKLFLRMTLILVLMSSGLWIAGEIGLVEWFFPRATSAVLPMCQFLICAQWALNLATPGIILCQYQGRTKSIIALLGSSAIVACFLQNWLMRSLQEDAYFLGLFLMGIIPALGAFFISAREQKTLPASS